jgi:uncharacterized protein YuzE
MTLVYDKETDSLSIKFRTVDIEETDEIRPGVLLDVDENDEMVSLEILNASNKIDSLEAFVMNSRNVVLD